MRLVEEKNPHINQFSGYGQDWVKVGEEICRNSVLVTSETLRPWRPKRVSDLQGEDFAEVLVYRPQVVLLGTGGRIRFPSPALYRNLTAAGIGVEVMDTGALCRTFNALASEGRKVAALVLFDAG